MVMIIKWNYTLMMNIIKTAFKPLNVATNAAAAKAAAVAKVLLQEAVKLRICDFYSLLRMFIVLLNKGLAQKNSPILFKFKQPKISSSSIKKQQQAKYSSISPLSNDRCHRFTYMWLLAYAA